MSKLRTQKIKNSGRNRSKLLQRIVKEIERQKDEVSRISEVAQDGKDGDILSYVASFQEDCRNLPKLEKFSLKTPEDAENALSMIDKTHAEVDRLLKNARALRVLLEREA